MTRSATATGASDNPAQLLAERTKRILDASELRQPDRVPIQVRFGYMLAELEGISHQELHENPERARSALVHAALRFQPDTASGIFGNHVMARILGDRSTKWPGYGLGPNGSYQYIEDEYMKAEDYDDFLDDPSDWALRVYVPRTFSKLQPFATLPPVGILLEGYYGLMSTFGTFMDPKVREAVQAFSQAIDSHLSWIEQQGATARALAAAGFPSVGFTDFVIQAPFDFMSDSLRGMKGIFLDMRRCPDKLLEAEEKSARLQLKFARDTARRMRALRPGSKVYAFTATHRGSDEFMSLAQFERFYWPQFKDMLLKEIEAGITPYVFYEGFWDKRLEYLAELPKGKTIGYFQSTNIFRAKEVLGDTMCIVGGMPVSLLSGGTVQQVRELTKKLCQIVGKGGGFIMTTTTGELEGCKPELVKAWVDATVEYGGS